MSAQTQRTSLSGQIDAIRRMIAHVQRNRGALTPNMVAYEVRLLEGTIESLLWLERNQPAVRAAKAAEMQAMIQASGTDL